MKLVKVKSETETTEVKNSSWQFPSHHYFTKIVSLSRAYLGLKYEK